MKKLIPFLIVFITISCFAQSAVRFIDSETGEPRCEIYSNIYKNGDTFENCGGSNKDGYLQLRIRNIDSTATYQFSFNYLEYEHIWKKIDINKKDTLIVYLKKDDYYIQNKKNLLYTGCSTYSLPNYYPREPRSLKDVPDSIAEKVNIYLKERVGTEIFKNFKLTGGQIVDIKEYKKRNPESKTKIAYYLCFSYRNLKAGIGMYSSKIHLDEFGNVLKDIGFPKVSKNSIQENLVSLVEIKNKAIEKGFYKEGKTEIQMAYSTKDNILVWKFINETYSSDYTYLEEELFYNAHNGIFIKLNSNKGEWID